MVDRIPFEMNGIIFLHISDFDHFDQPPKVMTFQICPVPCGAISFRSGVPASNADAALGGTAAATSQPTEMETVTLAEPVRGQMCHLEAAQKSFLSSKSSNFFRFFQQFNHVYIHSLTSFNVKFGCNIVFEFLFVCCWTFHMGPGFGPFPRPTEDGAAVAQRQGHVHVHSNSLNGLVITF